MSKLLKDTFVGLGKVGAYLAKGYMLKKEDGARFATSSEEGDLFHPRNRGLIVDGVKKRLSEKDSFEHIAIIAPPGKGKSTGYIRPNIFDKASQHCSMVITDPSGELYDDTSQHLNDKGFEVLTLRPDNLTVSSKFNPFHGLDARDVIKIEQVCASIVLSKYGGDKEGVWNDGAISLLEVFAKCLAYTMPKYLNLPNLNYLCQMFGADGADLDDWVTEHSINPYDASDNSIVDSWTGIVTSNERMLSSYATIARTALKQLNNRQVQQLLSVDDIDLANFRKKKTAIYLIIPENERKYYQFLVDIFYSRFFSIMMDHELLPNELDVYCFLDEFGNSYIDDFQTIVNNIRKYRVSLSMVFQGVSQISEKYGDIAGQSIKSGIGTFMLYAGADYQTASEQSNILGKRRIIHRDNLIGGEEKYTEVDLLPPDKIRTLENNQVLFVSSNRHPVIFEFTPFYQNGKYKSMARKGAYQQPPNRHHNTFHQLRLWEHGDARKQKLMKAMTHKKNNYEYDHE